MNEHDKNTTIKKEELNKIDSLVNDLETIHDLRCEFPRNVKRKTDCYKLFGSITIVTDYDQSGHSIMVNHNGHVKQRTIVRGERSKVFNYKRGKCVSSQIVDTKDLSTKRGLFHSFQELDVAREVLDCLYATKEGDLEVEIDEATMSICHYTDDGMVEYFVDTIQKMLYDEILILKVVYAADGLERSRLLAIYRDGILVECESPINKLQFVTRYNKRQNTYAYYQGGKLTGSIKCDDNNRPVEISSYTGKVKTSISRFEYWD